MQNPGAKIKQPANTAAAHRSRLPRARGPGAMRGGCIRRLKIKWQFFGAEESEMSVISSAGGAPVVSLLPHLLATTQNNNIVKLKDPHQPKKENKHFLFKQNTFPSCTNWNCLPIWDNPKLLSLNAPKSFCITFHKSTFFKVVLPSQTKNNNYALFLYLWEAVSPPSPPSKADTDFSSVFTTNFFQSVTLFTYQKQNLYSPAYRPICFFVDLRPF